MSHDERSGAATTPGRSASPPGIAGLRVLSFGTAIAGNVTAMALAELGADVVKVESPTRPDPLRVRIYPDQPAFVEPTGAETNIMFAGYSRSVRGIALDMKAEADQQTFARLLAVADVLIDNYVAGVMDRWGFTAERITALNPALVHISISGYGRTGPRAGYLAYGSNVNAYIGMSRAWVPHGTQLDYASVAHALPAVLAALRLRDRTGTGVRIDLAQTEAGVSLAAPLYLGLLNGAPDLLPGPNEVPGSWLSAVLPCHGTDRWVALEIEDAQDWNALCQVLGEPELGPEAVEGFDRPAPAALEKLTAALGAWCQTRTPYQAMFALQRAGLAAGAVQDGEDLFRDPQHRSNGFFEEIEHPDLGVIEYPAPFQRFSRTEVAVRRPAPRLGQHGRQVLTEWLGEPSGQSPASAGNESRPTP